MPRTLDTLEDFITFIKIKLGDPVIRVDDITDDQMEIAVDHAVRKFHDDAAGIGTFDSVLSIATSAHVSEYDIPDNVNAIIDSFDSNMHNGIGVLFSYENMAYNAGIYKPVTDTLTLQMWLSAIRQHEVLYGTKYTAVHREYENKAVISPTPSSDGILYFKISEKLPHEACYKNEWVQDYAVALAKIQIGTNRSKYDGIAMPGGGTINGQVWKDEGIAEKERLEELLATKWSEPPDFFLG